MMRVAAPSFSISPAARVDLQVAVDLGVGGVDAGVAPCIYLRLSLTCARVGR